MPREARQSQNRRVFRQVNERIADLAGSWMYDGEPLGLICECHTVGCATTVWVPVGVYATVREDEGTCLVAPGHEELEHEDVVERRADYLIVRLREARRAAEDAAQSATALRPEAEQQVRPTKRASKRAEGRRGPEQPRAGWVQRRPSPDKAAMRKRVAVGRTSILKASG